MVLECLVYGLDMNIASALETNCIIASTSENPPLSQGPDVIVKEIARGGNLYQRLIRIKTRREEHECFRVVDEEII